MPRGNKNATGKKADPTKRQRAREYLLAGLSVENIAARIGVSKWTVIRWRREPEFAARLEAHRESLLKMAEDRNAADLERALELRREIMESDDAKIPDKLRAIEGIIAMATETAKRQAAVTVVHTKITAEDMAAVRRHFEEELRAAGWVAPTVVTEPENGDG